MKCKVVPVAVKIDEWKKLWSAVCVFSTFVPDNHQNVVEDRLYTRMDALMDEIIDMVGFSDSSVWREDWFFDALYGDSNSLITSKYFFAINDEIKQGE